MDFLSAISFEYFKVEMLQKSFAIVIRKSNLCWCRISLPFFLGVKFLRISDSLKSTRNTLLFRNHTSCLIPGFLSFGL